MFISTDFMIPPWRALGTQPRAEIAISRFIGELGFACCCPSYKLVTVYHGRKRESVVPFINSYVFARFDLDAETWHRVMGVSGVSRILMGRVTDEEILKLRHQVGDDTGVLSYEVKRILRRINVGDQVVLNAGVFGGTSGIVDSVDDELQVGGIKISLLGREMVVNQPLAWCEPSLDLAGRSFQPKQHRRKRSLRRLAGPAKTALEISRSP